MSSRSASDAGPARNRNRNVTWTAIDWKHDGLHTRRWQQGPPPHWATLQDEAIDAKLTGRAQ